jgi:hypothetical protein
LRGEFGTHLEAAATLRSGMETAAWDGSTSACVVISSPDCFSASMNVPWPSPIAAFSSSVSASSTAGLMCMLIRNFISYSS